MLVSRWNSKMGILPSFSLPPIKTCPGRSPFCGQFCYGLRGRLAWVRLREIQEANLEASQQDDFIKRMGREIARLRSEAFRLHVVGDFYSADYVEKWVEIASSFPDMIFFGSTRSWRVPSLESAVEMFAALPNARMRASIDFTHEDRPDPGWKVISVEDDGVSCPHDYGWVQDCSGCRRCWQSKVSLRLKLRWPGGVRNLRQIPLPEAGK